ncbi:N-acetylmuramoyl-L-alanine amidase [Desulfacinum hydrothermale DSM 13146]|uniref:N-acetylmuramoyl-L-alanine amidase n=1 Tax=Desulfacinum hydrothermale DSM 13146 TaxID=1121390 RepID=A0A1W1XLW2_9BACT|nr:N-acetylmuramoyl-L-alanine amidase [Desulfacinum hydrothermale]SMC24933.1 N-acetylmuramoyl-L-alanine amidase [Desulfacinum hydrothermale DSM 13146]
MDKTRTKGFFLLCLLFLGLTIVWGPGEVGVRSGEASSLKERYEAARRQYHKLLGTLRMRSSESAFRRNIQAFRDIHDADPGGALADRALFLIGRSHHHLYDVLGRDEDFQAALDAYKEVVKQHPQSSLADDAQFLRGILYEGRDPAQAYLEYVRVTVRYPQGDMARRAQERAQKLAARLRPQAPAVGKEGLRETHVPPKGSTPGGSASHSQTPPAGSVAGSPAYLEEVQYWSAAEYTRVVVYLDRPVSFRRNTLPADPAHKMPARIYLDFEKTELSPTLKKKIDIKDGLLTDVRIGQYAPDKARVVLDLESMESHRIFSLADPFRVVIDVRGTRRLIPPQAAASAKKGRLPSIARQLGLTVRRIVIDPGHGGKDKGAIGPHGVWEKNITLALAKRLKKYLERDGRFEVFLTRSTDRYVSLEERTAIANTRKADLFISIHTNAHKDHRLGGVETYILNLSTDGESARVAALENAVSAKQISDLEAILQDLMQNTKISESSRLAQEVHRKLVAQVGRFENVRDLGIKQAPFYVLLGAEMPAILVETAFISNPREEKLLTDRRFQKKVAQGIAQGIRAYVEAMDRVATLGGGA